MFVFYVFGIGYVNDDIIIDGDILFELDNICFIGCWIVKFGVLVKVFKLCNKCDILMYFYYGIGINIYGLVVILKVILWFFVLVLIN